MSPSSQKFPRRRSDGLFPVYPEHMPPVGEITGIDFKEVYTLLAMVTDFEFDCDYSHPSGCQTHNWLAPTAEELELGCPNDRRKLVLKQIEKGFVL